MSAHVPPPPTPRPTVVTVVVQVEGADGLVETRGTVHAGDTPDLAAQAIVGLAHTVARKAAVAVLA